MKLTKQGVRDLNSIPSKPRGVKPEAPPPKVKADIEMNFCRHARIKTLESGDSRCLDCDTIWDWNGEPY